MALRRTSNFSTVYNLIHHQSRQSLLHSSRVSRHPLQQRAAAPLSTSHKNQSAQQKESTGKNDMGSSAKKEHVLEKDNHYDIQSSASKTGREERQKAEKGDVSEKSNASQATTGRDHAKSNEKAKKDFPEAPEPIIGMNDERGGKGH